MKKLVLIAIASLGLVLTSCKKEEIKPKDETIETPILGELQTIKVKVEVGGFNQPQGFFNITKYLYVNGEIGDSLKTGTLSVQAYPGDTVTLKIPVNVGTEFPVSTKIFAQLEHVGNFITGYQWLEYQTPSTHQFIIIEKSYIVQD